MSSRTKTYLDFMDWLKDHHSEIHKKYHNNFNVPRLAGEGITVNHSFRISQQEYEMLNKITQSYYQNG